jgi:hypothetical protein
MSEDARSEVKTNQKRLNNVISEQLGRFITVALSKLKSVWKYENTLSGIQFYGDLED